MKPRTLSLFSGIGGIDLAFQNAGFEIIGQIENDEFCNKVLEKHWPKVPRWGDISLVESHAIKNTVGKIDIMVGGFPCQNISVAGKKEGMKVGNQSGLWFEFRRLISDIRPEVVFLENVAAITVRGGTRVIGDLAEMGYDCQWGMLRASDAGAPHKRERWFCIAELSDTSRTRTRLGQLNSSRQERGSSKVAKRKMVRQKNRKVATKGINASDFMGNTYYKRRNRTHQRNIRNQNRKINKGRHNIRSKTGRSDKLVYPTSTRLERKNGEGIQPLRITESSQQQPFESMFFRILDGLPKRLDEHRWPARPNQQQFDWEEPRIAPPGLSNRAARIKALGNAVVPQVVQPIAEEILLQFFPS